jgi:hypothetical protein
MNHRAKNVTSKNVKRNRPHLFIPEIHVTSQEYRVVLWEILYGFERIFQLLYAFGDMFTSTLKVCVHKLKSQWTNMCLKYT